MHTRRRTLSFGIRLVSLPRNHKHQDWLRDDFEENPHTPAFPWEFTTSRCVLARTPPDHSYRDLGFLHSRCDQLSLTLAGSCWGGRSPVIASPRVSPPPDALCHPRPDSSSSKRRLQRSCFWSRFSSSAKRRLTGGSRLQGVPPLHSEWTSRASPLLSNGFASWGSPSPMRIEFAS